jgi:aspartate kinase
MAHGFLKKLFEVFDTHETSIDMITTSEIAISLTIDDTKNLDAILENLKAYGEITVELEHSIICVVGEGLIDDKNTPRLFEVLNNIPVRMISYGGSINNVSLLVATENKIATLKTLHEKLFSRVSEILEAY